MVNIYLNMIFNDTDFLVSKLTLSVHPVLLNLNSFIIISQGPHVSPSESAGGWHCAHPVPDLGLHCTQT